MFDSHHTSTADPMNLTRALRFDFDVRAHLLVAFSVIVTIALITRVTVALTVMICAVVLALCIVPSRRTFARRLAFPVFTGFVLLLLQAYTYGTTTVCIIVFPIFLEGVASGVLIFSRILASVSILLLLVQIIPPLQLIQSLAWFKIPSEIRQMMLLILRYVTVLTREATCMFRAQKARLGYSSKLKPISKVKNLSIIAGMTIVRAYDRSHQIFLSMKARGYPSAYSVADNLAPFKTIDYVFVLFSFMLILCIVFAGVI